jgi:DNA-binding CsgD family transcriptional regulator
VSERLSVQDVTTLQRCLAELYALGDLAGFRRRVVDVLSTAVRGDAAVYVELDPRRRTLSWSPDTVATLGVADGPRIYATHIGDLPLMRSYQRGEGSAVKISDFLTQRQFRRTALYNEFYRQAGIEYHMAKGLPGPPELVTAIGIVRRGRDFSERDRLLLNLLRPHLNQSYRNAALVTRLQGELASMHERLDAGADGVVVVARDGRVALMTNRARAWIAAYFGPTRNGALPDELRRWVRWCDEGLHARGDAPPAHGPLVRDREDRRLTIRLIRDDDRRLLLLDEQVAERPPDRLRALGLSRREAEVLAWVAEGKTNAEIATILGGSVRTVDKHLQHVFAKLGVETRTAAAVRALALRPR